MFLGVFYGKKEIFKSREANSLSMNLCAIKILPY